MSVTHDSFTLERQIAASAATVFDCWADPVKKKHWFVESDGPGWDEREYTLDFRVGGTETGRFVLTDGPGAGEHRNTTYFLEIETDQRIVFAYTMALNGRIHSASLATVTFEPNEGGTRLVYTEQITTIGQSDGAAGRSHGWTHLLNSLEAALEGAPA